MKALTERLLAEIRHSLPSQPPKRLGVAVSGGGDSVALLHLLTRCFADQSVELHAVTVDHGLRPEAAEEAQAVASLASSLGVRHDILVWRDWDGGGNLQDQARRARYHLLTEWAVERNIPVIALGHTADDQAETVLMRLGRAAGVDGLSAMSVQRQSGEITLLRPLLSVTRADLRDYLQAEGVSWIEDPSNQDDRFNRIKARSSLEALRPLGISAQMLADVASNMARSRDALEHYVSTAARDHGHIDGGDVILDWQAVNALPDEIGRRLILRAIRWIVRSDYAPRRQPVEAALNAVQSGKAAQVGGCLVLIQGTKARICREFQAVRDLRVPVGSVWDQRWRLKGDALTGAEIGALGPQGVQQCRNRRETGRHHDALLASPALWQGDQLIAAPLAGYGAGWTAELCIDEEEFFSSSLSH